MKSAIQSLKAYREQRDLAESIRRQRERLAESIATAKGEPGQPGEKGDKGDKGEKGDKPAHQWQGTMLRFERPDGTWGRFVDLQGPKGARGPRGGGGIASGGGDASYIRETPMTITVGGATIGTTFNGTIQDALDLILYPYAAPAFTAFALSGYSTMEVGAEIPAGAQTFTWATSNSDNVTADSLSISNTTDAITLADGTANDGTETVTFPAAVTRSDAGYKQFQIAGTNSASEQFSRTLNVNWYWRIYYGESEDTSLDTEVEIEALRASLLAASASRTYSFLGGGYKWLAYPVSMGLKTTFTDPATGFPVAMEVPITVSLTNQYGITANYYVHRTYNPLGSDIQIAVS